MPRGCISHWHYLMSSMRSSVTARYSGATMLILLLASAVAAQQQPAGVASSIQLQPPRCDETPDSAHPSDDLYCVRLVATANYAGAAGIAELRHAPTPFGVAVTRDGEHQYRFVLTLSGLPELRNMGPKSAYVAWLTTPRLTPMIKLGVVGNGRTELKIAGFNKFL